MPSLKSLLPFLILGVAIILWLTIRSSTTAAKTRMLNELDDSSQSDTQSEYNDAVVSDKYDLYGNIQSFMDKQAAYVMGK